MDDLHGTILVKDFTRPSAVDSAEGIRSAIRRAIETNAHTVIFESGRYRLRSSIHIKTEGIVHDVGSGNIEASKDCYISLNGIGKLTLQGALGEDGEPATILVGDNDCRVHSFLPAIFWCEDCKELTVQNLAFTREPEFVSAGMVTGKKDTGITVEVFEGNPCYDGMGVYCANRFDPETGDLTGESVTYGNGAESLWKQIGNRTLSLASSKVAQKVEVGEYLSWHQGAQTDFQVYFGRCNRLKLCNLRTFNANGFCMLAESCRDITADKIVFKPDGNRLFTGPRDAWKLFKCSGNIEINNMYIQGVRMDGQNMHSNWLFFKEKRSPREAVFFCKYTYAEIRPGTIVEFYDHEKMEQLLVIKSYHEKAGDGGHYYRVLFERDIPEFAAEGTLCAAACWEPDSYLCRNSEFVNIAGAGHLVRFDHLTILNCRYKNTMNPGILLGAELPGHTEGGHATDILVKGCTFDNCGFFPRYTAEGCIGIKSAGFQGRYNHDVIIANNLFMNAGIGVHALDADRVYILNNKFENIKEPVVTDHETTGSIFFK